MLNLSWALERIFELHGSLPRRLARHGWAFAPVHMLMEVTYRCNLRCNFCQYLDIIEGRQAPRGPFRNDVPRAAIEQWIDDFPRGALISFAGGEATVRKDFPDILHHATRRHRVHIITNGVRIDETTARTYVDLAPRRIWQNGLVLLEVSLQGTQAVHDRVTARPGSWRSAVDGMRHLVRLRRASGKKFPKLDFKLVITRDTVDSMVDYMHLAADTGVDLVNFMAEHDLKGNSQGEQTQFITRPQRIPVGVDPNRVREQLIRCFELEAQLGVQLRLTPNLPIDEFARHYHPDRELPPENFACEGVWSRIGIAADGRVGTVCPYFATPDVDITTARMPEAWNGPSLRAFRNSVRDARVYPGCHGCCNLKYIGDKKFGLAGVASSPPWPSDDVGLEPLRLRASGS